MLTSNLEASHEHRLTSKIENEIKRNTADTSDSSFIYFVRDERVNWNRLGSEIPNIQFISYLCDNMGIRNVEGASVQTRKEGTEINKRIMRRTPKRYSMF